MTESQVRIVSIYPTLLGTYGDGGNVLALRHRARLHNIAVSIHEVTPGDPVPADADLYVIGGGEDTAQVAAANALRADAGLATAVDRGATVLAICAGYQLIGNEFPDALGAPAPGVGIIDITTDRLPQRAVGELVAKPAPGAPTGLTDFFPGYENHAGATPLGAGVRPLASVESGIGNGDGTEGAVAGRVIGTYLHGPALARNPQLADQLLSWVTDRELAEIVEDDVAALRRERIDYVARNS